MSDGRSPGRTRHRPPYIFAALLLIIGVVLAGGGAWLIALGGSWYYILAGAAVVASAVLLMRGRRWGMRLYLLVLLGTALWALWEVGWNGWALAPRVLPPAVLGLWFLTPWATRGLDGDDGGNRPFRRVPRPLARAAAAGIGAVAVMATSGAAVFAGGHLRAQAVVSAEPAAGPGEWANYGNTLHGTRFSPLTQITPANVGRLEHAWTFHTGDTDAPKGTALTHEATPLMINGTLFTCTPHNVVIALDPETGRQLWRFDPKVNTNGVQQLVCRGVAFYHVPEATGPCADRIIEATTDARLIALDAASGAPCAGFGRNGTVSLLEHMGDVLPGFSYVTSPPTIVSGHAVLGGWITDNESVDEPSGVIRSFDPVSGALQWAFDMGVPDRVGPPPEGQHYTRGTPNAWTVFAADPALNLVYVPTGGAPPDFWGGKRRRFDERYADSVLALDVATGRPRWTFQTSHHDLWDYDIPAQPVLVDVPVNGAMVPALVQATKKGDLYLLDRRYGQPLAAVREKPVPQAATEGDRTAPTQPYSVGMPNLRRPDLTERSMWGITPIDQMICRIRFQKARYQGLYTPITTRPTVTFPGALGVIDWGGLSVDADRKVIIANTSAVAYYNRLVPRAEAPAEHRNLPGQPGTAGGKGPDKFQPAQYNWGAQVGTPYVFHTEPFLGVLGVPCTEPPWGFLTAIDLKTRRIVWDHPIGTGRDSGPRLFGTTIPSMLPIKMGVPNLGGTVTTRSGLVFMGATVDRYLRAFDERTGRRLWQARLPAGGQATPLTFISPKSGRQFVVITAGGHASLKTKAGDAIVAFALPRSAT